MRSLAHNRWFALTELLLVLVSAAAWVLIPQFGIGFSMIALLPWVLRFLAGRRPFQQTPFDWLIAIFLVTAWIGYWAAYDRPAAWVKAWLIVSAVLLYYALLAQPRRNLKFLSFLSFCFAFSLFLYFCLTYDFSGIGGRFGFWWMNYRPYVEWPPVHPGYLSGLVFINTILGSYWLWSTGRKLFGPAPVVMQLFLLLGTAMAAFLFVLTVSRGIGLVGLGVAGFWMLWKVSTLSGSNGRVKAIFPVLALGYLFLLIAAAYLGPASDAADGRQDSYGTNSRTEVLERGAHFLVDYPVTGAGLASFPGIYSQYMLVIPHFYFTNSYNLFLDVAIEQGVPAGSILILLYLGGVFLISRAIANNPADELQLIRWLGLCALMVTIVHGLFYDYLYNGNGTVLLFYPLGMALTGVVKRSRSAEQGFSAPRARHSGYSIGIGIALALLAVFAFNTTGITSVWNANLGAVQMSRVQLKDFPTNEWETSEVAARLEGAETTLQLALHGAPFNQTANHRLGLISLLRQDFKTAAARLETAYRQAPDHRGITKSLGYCYVWLGNLEKARQLLERIPEAQNEMKVYIWWWETQDRPDLSERASQMASRLDTAPE